MAAQIPHLSGFIITILIAISLNTVSFPSAFDRTVLFWLLFLLFAIGLGWIFLKTIALFVAGIAIAMSLILIVSNDFKSFRLHT